MWLPWQLADIPHCGCYKMREFPGESVMKTLITRTLAACLLAVSFAGHCSSPGKDAGKVWLRANIVLDAAGNLTSIEWLNTKPSAQFVTSRLEDVVRGWSFEPGKLNGVPAITHTGLSLDITVKKTARDTFVLNIDDARTGAVYKTQDPPFYPGNQARMGASAYIVLALDTDEAGKVVSATVTDYAGNSGNRSSRRDFEAAALNAVNSWTYQPEIVGGKALASKLSVPISFCMDSWCAEHERKLAASGKDLVPSGTSVALDSAVKILTRTASVEI